MTAPSVSAVSPDWDRATISVVGPTSASRYRNSEPRSASAGSPASRSTIVRPTMAAWYEVPQATRTTRSIARTTEGSRAASARTTLPVSGATRPRTVSVTARGCS